MAEAESHDPTTEVKCVHCGYEWETESELQKVTCPSCQGKTPAEQEETRE